MRRNFGLAFWPLAICLLPALGFSNVANADDDLGNAKQFCKRLGEMIASRKIDDAVAAAVQASYGGMNENNISAALQGLKGPSEQVKKFDGPYLLAEKNYGDHLARAYYLILADNTPLYLFCQSVKGEGPWILNSMDVAGPGRAIPLP